MIAAADSDFEHDAPSLPLHEEKTVALKADTSTAFAYLDDHRQFSSHMSKSSWRMGGAKMEIMLDDQKGQAVGSKIRLAAQVLGLNLSVEEIITQRVVPTHKEWQTIGTPRLLVIGHYRMGFDVTPQAYGSAVRIFIDYEPSPSRMLKLVSKSLGRMYAKWCVEQMAADAQRYFSRLPVGSAV